MTKTEFLPCPFCGHTEYEPEISIECRTYTASCGYCGASAEYGESQQDAIDNWNTRPKPNTSQDYKHGFVDCRRQMLEILNKLELENGL